jgi:hypothetical protein
MRPSVLAFVACGLAVLANAPALSGPFFVDDLVYVVGNDAVQSMSLFRGWELFLARTNPYEYLPLRDLSYLLDFSVWGLSPWGYHLHNLLLYALCCAAVWLCTRALVTAIDPRRFAGDDAPPAQWFCMLVTAIFAVHPAHVESVAWISGRKELLSGLLALLCLRQFIGACAISGAGQRMSRRRLARLIASTVLFAAALLVKATVLPVALIALLLAAVLGRAGTAEPGVWSQLRRCATAALLALPLLLTAGFFLWLLVRVGGETSVLVTSALGAPTELARYEQALAILGYLTRIGLWPHDMRLMYDVLEPGLPKVLAIMLGSVALIAGGVGVWLFGRSRSPIGLGLAAFVLLCAPFVQLIRFSTWSLASERFLFLPIFAIALVVAGVMAKITWRWRAPIVAAILIAGLFLTFDRSRTWRSADELLLSNARQSPALAMAQDKAIFLVYLPQRDYAAAERAAGGVRDSFERDRLLHLVGAKRACSRQETRRRPNSTRIGWPRRYRSVRRPTNRCWSGIFSSSPARTSRRSVTTRWRETVH